MSVDDNKVVFLKFNNPRLKPDARTVLSCVQCANKTFTVVFFEHEPFPIMHCAGCGTDIGRIGWAPGPDENI
jgi:hypothetical protein